MLLSQTTFIKFTPLFKYYSISLLSFQQNSFKWVVLTIFNSSPPNFSLVHNVNEIALVTLTYVLHSVEFYFQFSVNWNFNSIWHTNSIWPGLIFCTTLKYSLCDFCDISPFWFFSYLTSGSFSFSFKVSSLTFSLIYFRISQSTSFEYNLLWCAFLSWWYHPVSRL